MHQALCIPKRKGPTSWPIPPRRICPAMHRVHETAGVDWDIEKVSFLRVQGPVRALQQVLVQQHLNAVGPRGDSAVVGIMVRPPDAGVLTGATSMHFQKQFRVQLLMLCTQGQHNSLDRNHSLTMP